MQNKDRDPPPLILVVDDESAIRYSFTKTLQRVGYRVDAAGSGEEARVLLDKATYDVVLTDIRMPGGISGVELLRHIRENTPDTSVILVTGYASLGTAVESLRLGAHDYLVKPASSRDIRESVARGVERAENMRKRRDLLSMIHEGVKQLSSDDEPTIPEAIDIQSFDESVERTASATAQEELEIGGVVLYPGRYQLSVDGETIDLTPTEFDLLLYLVAHRGRVVPCSELVREVRGYTLEESNAREVIRPHISNMRRKIERINDSVNLIINVRGAGYRLADV